MGQFVLRFSKRMWKKHSYAETVELAQKQHGELQAQHEKRVDTLDVGEPENSDPATSA